MIQIVEMILIMVYLYIGYISFMNIINQLLYAKSAMSLCYRNTMQFLEDNKISLNKLINLKWWIRLGAVILLGGIVIVSPLEIQLIGSLSFILASLNIVLTQKLEKAVEDAIKHSDVPEDDYED